jgi:hypothetical protein
MRTFPSVIWMITSRKLMNRSKSSMISTKERFMNWLRSNSLNRPTKNKRRWKLMLWPRLKKKRKALLILKLIRTRMKRTPMTKRDRNNHPRDA